MNPITPKNIHRHELIGLNIEIVKSADPKIIGTKGIVIDETQHMFVIQSINNTETIAQKRIKIQKKICSFRFTLPTGELVDIEGSLLNSKSENRIKNIIRKRW
ncbi:MAG TPA: ribonuclease P protein subunit [candidate division Zixibacteria bacterium]|nr:ribonuclease P protein subunit [candidate division Zixibacteria bacterium]